MTITYNPRDPKYFDEADLRDELTRVYDLCHGCRLCWNLCPSFGSLFKMIDAKDGAVEALTPAEQDRVVDECYQCKLCYVKCPYVPPHEWMLDFPRLMMRAAAVLREEHGGDVSDEVLARTDVMGTLSSAVAPLANAVIAKPNSLTRKLMEKATGIAAARVLPLYSRERFSTWFKRRQVPTVEPKNGNVALFQTCMVEYQNPAIGQDAVKVLEHNQITCHVPQGTLCCGMPWLDAGNIGAFLRQARKNVDVLSAEVAQGRDIVVPQPTCGYVLKREYAEYLGGEQAAEVGTHTYDLAEYLMNVHRAEGKGLNLEFNGQVPETITWHAPCHLRAQNVGFKSRDLMRLTGAKVTVVDRCAGIDGTWGLRAKNYELAKKVAEPLKAAIEKAGSEQIAGDCHLANGAIVEETGQTPLHPMQILARAYGIPEEPKA
jgi:Fe-S oxidoreductase